MKVKNIKNITVSQTELAKVLNLTDRRVRQLVEEKIILRDDSDPSGGVFLFDSLKNYWLRQAEKGGDDYFKVKTEHEELKKQLTDLKLQERQSELVEMQTVLDTWADILITLRTNLLSLPAKFASQLENKSASEISAILTEEIEMQLTELSHPDDCGDTQ